MKCVHELVEEQADRAPGALAVVDGAERLTYAELDARADRAAGLLAARGVRRGDTVGVRLDRSAALVVAVLGVLKAGAGYVMLDPGFPAARLRGMAADAGVRLVLTDRAGGASDHAAAPGTGEPLRIEDAGDAEPLPRGAGRARPGDISCVMFTSGSTGRPKGAAAPHRAVTETLTGQEFASFGPGAVWLQCAPLSWDAFALELWGPLMNGGTCVLHPGRRPEPLVIGRLVAEHGVTSMYLSSSLFNVIADEYPDALDGLRELIVGGEAMSAPHVAATLRRAPALRVSNGYGPVECMVFVSVHPVTPEDVRDGGPVPIGRPLRGTRLHVLDEDLRPVPDGTPGELYAAGAGLARDYRGRPRLTAESFVPEPGGPPGGRAYRTGDLVRRRPDGVLEHLGRADAQVKIRGFRVEPGEVESVLARHPGVDRAAVVPRDQPDGDRQLVAYVVPPGGRDRAPSAEELRAHAATLLADYLVPAAFVPLDALPLTATGKLDRAALPDPAPAAAGAGADDPAVGALCGMFAQVLRLPAVGADDNFFALGGHSLLAARLLGRIRAVLGAEVGIRALFEDPTPARLAPRVAAAPRCAAPPPVPAGAALPVSDAQYRLWFLDRLGAGAAYTMPMLVRLRGDVDPDALAAALARVAERHEVLRTVFDEADGTPVRRVRTGADARPPLERWRIPAAELDARIAEQAGRAFGLSAELPVRAALFTLEDRPGEHALLVSVHHIAGDGWSLAPLFRDLSRAYAAERAVAEGASTAEGTAALPALPAGYAELAGRRAALLGDPADPASLAARQLGYWRRQLADLPAGGPLLPRRADRPAVPGPRAAVLVRHLDAAAHRRVVEAARAQGATLFMALHAALLAVLLRAGAGPDTAIGAPVAGRGADSGAEDLVGFFVNMLVLRTDASGDPDAAGLLARVRETDLAAFAHQDVPFEQVTAALNPPRPPGRQPFTDVVLALQNNARADVTLPGADGVEVVRTGTARFELLVDVTDTTAPDGTPGGLTLTVEHRADCLDDTTAGWLADALPHALTAAAADPATPLSRLCPTAPPRLAGPADDVAPPARSTAAGTRPPRPGAESDIAAVWCDVLGLAGLGRDDDFFAIGGNSLRAVRVAARLSTPERPVTAGQLFTAPTVAALAAALERAGERPPSAAAPIPRRPRVPRPPAGAAGAPRTPGGDQQEEKQCTSA